MLRLGAFLAALVFFTAKASAQAELPASEIEAMVEEARSLAQSDPERGLSLAETAIERAQRAGDRALVAKALIAKGYAHFSQADFSAALEAAIESRNAFTALQDPAGLTSALNLIASVYGRTGQGDKAVEVFLEALEAARESGDPQRIGGILGNIGINSYYAGEHEKALDYLRQGLDVLDDAATDENLTMTRLNMAAIIADIDATELDMPVLQDLLVDAQALGNARAEMLALQTLANVAAAQGELSAADQYAARALDIAEKNALAAEHLDILQLRSMIAEMDGRLADALAVERTATSVARTVFSEEQSRETARLREEFEAELRENQIALQEAEIARSYQLTLLAGAIALFSTLTAGLMYSRYLVKKRANALLDTLAYRDPLTGLLNRRAMGQHIDKASALDAEQGRRPIALAILDVDHFKRVNDRLGHPVGDQILCELASFLESSTRKGDHVARWGGEEFLILLEGLSIEDAVRACRRLCNEIAEEEFQIESGAAPKLTVSAGVVEFAPGLPAREHLRRADLALYAAKSGGRNRVEQWTPALDLEEALIEAPA